MDVVQSATKKEWKSRRKKKAMTNIMIFDNKEATMKNSNEKFTDEMEKELEGLWNLGVWRSRKEDIRFKKLLKAKKDYYNK